CDAGLVPRSRRVGGHRCMGPVTLSSSRLFSFCSPVTHRDLHSFPTRRSSDLPVAEDVAPPTERALRPSVIAVAETGCDRPGSRTDRKSTRLNSSHVAISYADLCLKKNTYPAAQADRDHPRDLHRHQRAELCAE